MTTSIVLPGRRNLHLENLEGVLLAAAAATVVFLLQWRYGFNWSDEGWLWYISQRTSMGQVPVRDVFSYDPGRYYWSAAIFKLLGGRGFFEQLVASYLFGIVGLAVAYIALVRVGIQRRWRLALLILLAIVLGYPRHKVYEQALSLICAAGITFVLAVPEERKRWFLYGIATGLAAFVGRNSGLYFAFAGVLAFVYLKSVGVRLPTLRTIGVLSGGIALGYTPIFFMMIFVHGFAPAFVRSVLLTPRWSWPLPIPFPWASHIHRLHGLDKVQRIAVSWLCIAVPVSYAITLWKALRSRPSGPRLLALGATLAGIPYLHHGFYHADFGHISQAVVPFVLVAGASSFVLWTSREQRKSLVYFAGAYMLTLACWLPSEPLVLYLRGALNGPGPIAEVQMYGKTFEVPADQAQVMTVVQKMFLACGGRDGSFYQAPYYPGLYAFLGTRSPTWDVYYLWRRSDQIQKREIQSIEQNRTSLVLINRVASFDRPIWLTIDSTNPLLPKYIAQRYEPIPAELPVNFEIRVLPGSCGMGTK